MIYCKHLFDYVDALDGQRRHVEPDRTNIGDDNGSKRHVLKSRPKTPVSRSQLGLRMGVRSRQVIDPPFEYDVSSDDEVIDSTTGVRRQGMGCLFPRGPKPYLTTMVTDDDLWKLRKTNLSKKIRRFEKHNARVNNFLQHHIY